MTTITCETKHLRALLSVAPKKDIRPTMNGVHFETGPNGTIAFVSNGHYMLVARLSELPLPEGKLFLPNGKWNIPAKGHVEITNTIDDLDMLAISLRYPDGSEQRATMPQVTMPPYRSVIPKSVSGEPGHFNPDYMALLGKAGKIAGWGQPQLTHNGFTGAALVRYRSPDAFGVIMPLRTETILKSPPDWLNAADQGAEEAA